MKNDLKAKREALKKKDDTEEEKPQQPAINRADVVV